jgi:uncharacterized protein YjiS (DUF1127 family)
MLSRSHAAHAAHTHWLDDLRAGLRVLARATTQAWRNAVSRRELASLDDRMLADIGLTRGDALREADRLPWEAGPHRQQPARAAGPSVWRRVEDMWQRHRTRQRIAQLDGSMLKDIGVSYADAEAEANKPFWRA